MKNENENQLNLKPKVESGRHPRLNQCYLCKGWYLEKNLSPIEIPDQAGWIEKKACQECLNKILDKKVRDENGV
jgi:hypothetical protein